MSERGARIEAVLDYHERTKHRYPNRYARALGYLDWATQPDPFRRFEGAPILPLAEIEPGTGRETAWRQVRSRAVIDPAPLEARTVAQLFYDSLAISAWKQAGRSRWSLRCNPSSGNLHPTEAYLLTGAIAGLTEHPALFHYAPRLHALELRRPIASAAWNALARELPKDAIAIALTSILWREAWKYGERAFRYCMHDVGHAIGALAIAARTLGWSVRPVVGLPDRALGRLVAIDEQQGIEAERPDVLLVIDPCGGLGAVAVSLSESDLDALCAEPARGRPNRLSSAHQRWPILDEVEWATRDEGGDAGDQPTVRDRALGDDGKETHNEAAGTRAREVGGSESAGVQREVWTESAGLFDTTHSPRSAGVQCDVRTESAGMAGAPEAAISARVLARRRRSAVDLDGLTAIPRERFFAMVRTLMRQTCPALHPLPFRPHVHPLFFLHRIEGLAPGLAILIRSPEDAVALRSAMTRADHWVPLEGCPVDVPLHRIADGDTRAIARAVSCHQDIAADGAFAVAMLARFEPALHEHGASFYRRLHWEAGLLGQLLYLEAEAHDVQGTGIGCFFDDAVAEILGLRDRTFQILYGFTVGRGVPDPRIQVLPAYFDRSALLRALALQ